MEFMFYFGSMQLTLLICFSIYKWTTSEVVRIIRIGTLFVFPIYLKTKSFQI